MRRSSLISAAVAACSLSMAARPRDDRILFEDEYPQDPVSPTLLQYVERAISKPVRRHISHRVIQLEAGATHSSTSAPLTKRQKRRLKGKS